VLEMAQGIPENFTLHLHIADPNGRLQGRVMLSTFPISHYNYECNYTLGVQSCDLRH
jgi:hypothetical protein